MRTVRTKQKKKIIGVILVALFSFLFVISFPVVKPEPVFAMSSLQACAQQPGVCASLTTQTAAAAQPAQVIVAEKSVGLFLAKPATTAAIVKYTAAGAITAPIVTTVAVSLNQEGYVATAVESGTITKPDMEAMQDEMLDRSCQWTAKPSWCFIDGILTYEFYNPQFGGWFQHSIYSKYGFEIVQESNGAWYRIDPDGSKFPLYGTDVRVVGWKQRDIDGRLWTHLDDSSRTQIINVELNPDLYSGYYSSMGKRVTPEIDPGDKIVVTANTPQHYIGADGAGDVTIGGPQTEFEIVHIGQNRGQPVYAPHPNPTVPSPNPNPSPAPAPNPNPSPAPAPVPAPLPVPIPGGVPPFPSPSPAPAPNPNPSPTPAPVPGSDPGTDPNPNPNPSPTPAPVPDPVPDPGTDPNPDPSPNPNPTGEDNCQPVIDIDIEAGDVEWNEEDYACSPKLLQKNFVTHLFDVLIDKFPLDALGDFGSVTTPGSTCPSFTFWSVTKQLCVIPQVFSGVKWVVWITFLIKALVNL